MISNKEYRKIRNKAYSNYKKIRKIYCPNLETDVLFNTKGFYHIVHRTKRYKRSNKNQIVRFSLLDKASRLIGKTTTLQEYQKTKTRNSRRKESVEYFGYIAIVDSWKIKVIIKRFENQEPFFWSVIPNWITNKKRDLKYIKNFTGNMEID